MSKDQPATNNSRKSSTKTDSRSQVSEKAEEKRLATIEATRLIDERINSLDDWRGETLAAIRLLIHEADAEIIEECKWIKPSNPLGVPVWSHAGIVCTGEIYKQAVKLTFARGASLDDPHHLFNASLDGKARRAIDIHEGESLDTKALKQLITAAVEENLRVRARKSSGKEPA